MMWAKRIALFLLASLSIAGCDDLAEPGELRQAPGPGEDPALDGMFGVGWKESVDVNRWVFPDFEMDVFYPSLESGEFDETSAPYPVVFLLQGALTARADYHWLADRLTSWGMVVVLPGYPLGLAAFGPERVSAALDRIERSMEKDTFWRGGLDLQRIAVGGHGLGGGLANLAVELDPRFGTLFLLGSAADDDWEAFPGSVLLMAAEEDCEVSVEEITAAFETYQRPRVLAELEGMAHYQFTDNEASPWDGCSADIELEVAHERVSSALVSFLKAYMAEDDTFLEYLTDPDEGISIDLQD